MQKNIFAKLNKISSPGRGSAAPSSPGSPAARSGADRGLAAPSRAGNLVPRSKKGAAMEMAIATVFVVGALCLMLATITMVQNNTNKQTRSSAVKSMEIDQLGFDIISAVNFAGGDNGTEGAVEIGTADQPVAGKDQTALYYTIYAQFGAEDNSDLGADQVNIWVQTESGTQTLYLQLTNKTVSGQTENLVTEWHSGSKNQSVIPEIPQNATVRYLDR